MSKYTVLFHKNTEKELRKIPNKDRIKIFEKIDELCFSSWIEIYGEPIETALF